MKPVTLSSKKSDLTQGGGTGAPSKTARQSGLELMRVVLMLSIIAHHYVVNSGIVQYIDTQALGLRDIFLLLWGMWGKTAINAFVLITGYFMCTRRLRWTKFLKLFFEIKFYRLLFTAIFIILGMYPLTFQSIGSVLSINLMTAGNSFPASILFLYLLIPFLNKWIDALGRSMLAKLIAVLVLLFTVTTTFFSNTHIFNEVFWYATLYLIAAYIRLYPMRWMDDRSTTGKLLLISLALSYVSVVGMLAAMNWTSLFPGLAPYYDSPTYAYFFVADSSKALALLVGVAAFMYFKNLDIGYIPAINTIASTAFGVLLIHANSDTMRRFVWRELLNVADMYYSPFPALLVQALLVPLGIYFVCGLLDMARIRYLERPLFRLIDRHAEAIEGFVRSRLKTINLT